MKTKVVNKEKKTVEKSFPKLMRSRRSGNLVFFQKPCCGQVVVTGGHGWSALGETSKKWTMCLFDDLPETTITFNVEE